MEQQLEAHESQHATSLRSVRNVDRTVRDLHTQISRRDKQLQSLTEDLNKGREKISRLLTTVDELQAEEARSQLAARRAERDLREEKEKALRLERELEGWKGLRMERVVKNGGISGGAPSTNGTHLRALAATNGNRISSGSGSGGANGAVGNRRVSESKGFL